MRPFRYATIYCLLVILLSCGKKENTPQNPDLPATVSVISIEAKDVPARFRYLAQTQSSQLVNIQARVNGFLEKRVYVEGEEVKKGQVLFLMDKKPFEVQVDSAKAALARQKAAMETAEKNLARVKPLAALNALSQKDLDDAEGTYQSYEAAVEQAKSQVESALLNLSYCTITSPLDGITSAALQQDGTYINVQDSKLTTVAALSPMWVNFSVSQNQLQNLQSLTSQGKLITTDQYQVRVLMGDGSYFPYVGHITFTEPYYNTQTGTFLIRASVDNPDGVLRPNQYVNVDVEGMIRPNAILVPQQAVQQSSKGQYVWVVDKNGKADMRPVVVGEWQGEDWLITDGLVPGELVVVNGVLNLTPGKKVKTQPYDPNTKEKS